MATAERIRQKKVTVGLHALKNRMPLFYMALPSLIMILLFSYGPMWGWSMAFIDYTPGISILESSFQGLKNFRDLFRGGSEFLMVLRNTFVLSGLRILCMPLPMIFALLLSEVRNTKFKRTVQTLASLPHFISWIIVYSLFFSMLSVDDGLINRILVEKLQILDRGKDWLADPKLSWGLMTFAGVWKSLGWSAIIYLAAISGIDPELYQAAKVDGANRFQQVLHITIPGILPTFAVILVISMGNLINTGFDQYFVFHNPMVHEKIEVLETYAYRIGLINLNFSYSTAVGVFRSLISISMLIIANYINKKILGRGIL
jgi:ABC-type polysaccharide transport system permease subunit